MGNSERSRRYDIDWLRIIAVLLLIPFHTLHIFVLKPYSIVYIKNQVGSDAFEKIAYFISTAHMPLLFFLAGASSYLSLQVRSTGRYLKERVRRLFLPLLTGIFILIPPMTYIYRISVGDKISFWTHYLRFFSKNPGDLSGVTGAFTPAHLWFILFLFIFSIAGIPVFRLLNKRNPVNQADIFTKRFALLLLVIPLALTAAVNILDDKNPIAYFVIFIIGYFIMTKECYQKAIDQDKLVYFILGAVFTTILLLFDNHFPAWSAGWVLYEFMRIANRLVCIYFIVGYGHQYLNRPSKLLSYLSKASFPVYVLHMPVNTIVGYFIVQTKLGVLPKAVIIMVLTTVLTFAAYELARRSKVISFMLGIKRA